MKFAGRVENVREVERALGRIADIGSEDVPDAVRAALEPMVGDLRRATPVDTGALRDSTRVAVLRRPRLAVGSVGWSGRRVRRAQMLAVEFGARRRPGRRVLSGLFDAAAMERRFVQALGGRIDDAWRAR